MMSLAEFKALDLRRRAKAIWKKGVFLESFSNHERKLNLYYLFGFYVELEIDQSEWVISRITPFRSGYRLEKYLERIEINRLLN